MGGNSTSHDAVLRAKKTSTSADFDLQNWQGLTEVLKRGKLALSNPTEYAAFRNLVLQYAQQGGDIEIKKKIISAIEDFSKTEVGENHEQKNVQINNPSPETPTVETAPEKISEAIATDTPRKQGVHTRRILPRFVTAVQKEVHEEGKAVSSSVTDVPLKSEIIPKMKEEHVNAVKNDSADSTTPTTQVDVVIARSTTDYRARIAEIKNSVHSQYGNPATLMSLRNGVGQIYMKALLLAMKSLTPGSDENEDVRMGELEVAYTALIQEATKENENAYVSEVLPEPVVSTPTPVAETIVPTIEPNTEKREFENAENENVLVIETEIQNEAPVVDIPSAEETLSEENTLPNDISSEATRETVPTPEPTLDQLSSRTSRIQNANASSQGADENNSNNHSDIVPRGILQNKYPSQRFSNVSAPVQNSTDAKQKDFEIKQSELVSEEISESLQKLLHDWSIFEGSGIFGIGPGGTEHPLYKKLANLSMSEVLAGRWEKSDPKITKIIKEYIDAWRHEQGIAYNTNETFEHYLRRVIQKILRRKNQ